jgi:hypothetical protein
MRTQMQEQSMARVKCDVWPARCSRAIIDDQHVHVQQLYSNCRSGLQMAAAVSRLVAPLCSQMISANVVCGAHQCHIVKR